MGIAPTEDQHLCTAHFGAVPSPPRRTNRRRSRRQGAPASSEKRGGQILRRSVSPPGPSSAPGANDAAQISGTGLASQYQRVNVCECTAWVQTNLEFDLEVRGPDQTTETRPYTVDTFREHHGAVEPTLYLTPGGKWFRACLATNYPVSSQSPRSTSKSVNHSPRSGCGPMAIRFRVAPRRSRPTPGFVIGEPLLPSKSTLTIFGMRATCHRRKSPRDRAALSDAIHPIPRQLCGEACRCLVAGHQGQPAGQGAKRTVAADPRQFEGTR